MQHEIDIFENIKIFQNKYHKQMYNKNESIKTKYKISDLIVEKFTRKKERSELNH